MAQTIHKHKESQQTPPPPPERHAQQNSRDERTNHNLAPTATESSIYTNSIFSPSADWDFDDLGIVADDSMPKNLDIPTNLRRELALDTHAIFLPSVDWDFDDLGIVADDSMPKNLDIPTNRRRALDTNTIFSPSADWDFDDDLGLAAGPAGNLTPVPVATFEHSNGTNNPFIKLEQVQPAYSQPWGWTSNRPASGSSTPTVYGRYNNPFIKLEQAQPAYGPGQ